MSANVKLVLTIVAVIVAMKFADRFFLNKAVWSKFGVGDGYDDDND
jgi:hypothetical protein